MDRGRLTAVPDVAASRPAADPRVRAAAAVLAGVPVEDAALQAGSDAHQVLRWAEALASGGALAVGGIGVDRPAAGPAGSTVPVEDFLAVVAHELRTPLTAARTALRVLASTDVPPAVRGTVATAVLDRLADLDRLTDDVLDAVGLVTGRLRLAPERVDLARAAAHGAAAAGVAHEQGPPVHVRADPVRLETVVRTLLGHAARYCSLDAVDVRVQALPEGALLTVRLRGVQADPRQAAAVFEPFGAAARGDGNGLAMYVVRALVVASGGAVGLAGSDGPAAATVLWARLPLSDPAPAPRQPVSLSLSRKDTP